jgi:hypothetical protein
MVSNIFAHETLGQKCLETKGISPDEQYDMCVTDVSLYYGKNTNDLEKAVCNNLESFALHCEEYGVTVDWTGGELRCSGRVSSSCSTSC